MIESTDLLIQALQPSPTSNEKRKQICNFVEGVVQKLQPGIRLLGSGSYTSRTYLPASDIDLVLFTSAPDDPCSSSTAASNSNEMHYILQVFQALCIEVSAKDDGDIA